MSTLTVGPGHRTVYVYVDGESNYIRTETAFRRKHGEHAVFAQAVFAYPTGTEGSYPDPGPVLRHRADIQFFWDTSYGRMLRGPIECERIAKVYYFGSIQGDDDFLHDAAVHMRANGCTPMLVRELKPLADRRRGQRATRGLIEKPKGVDALLVARLLDDAYRNNFDACVLLTSDADFIPAIEIVQRLGKPVLVFGYGHALGKRSRLLHVPDIFLDLEPHVQTAYLNSGAPTGA